MSKAIVRKDHDLRITVKQRHQKASEFLFMIPNRNLLRDCKGQYEGGEKVRRQYLPYTLV